MKAVAAPRDPGAGDGRPRRAAVWLAAAVLLAVPALARAEPLPSPKNLVSGQWTWVAGSSSLNAFGAYGTKGVEAPGNAPGARSAAASWKDGAGHFWLFGGLGLGDGGTAGDLSDLWRWNPSTGQWAWISGSRVADTCGAYGTLRLPEDGNAPGGRHGAAAWIDASGSLWLFGGYGWASDESCTAPALLNDLWKFDVTSGAWTWMGGSETPGALSNFGELGVEGFASVPGARSHAAVWTDSKGRFWLFGGLGVAGSDFSGDLNDLWTFNLLNGLWTWVGGTGAASQPGHYGNRGVPSAGNLPGGREASVTWTDGNGNLWLFGGYGWVVGSSVPNASVLNDLWKFDLATRQWTWIAGSSSLDPLGAYGTKGTAAPANSPGGRMSAVGWADAAGHLWLHGGYGLATTPSSGIFDRLGDLWRFGIAEGEWTWAGGSSSVNANANFGPLGTSAFSNDPGSRYADTAWTDSHGNLWLLGGYGGGLRRSDLWAYANPWSGSTTCTSDDLGLCLLEGRYRVTAEYGDYAGHSGQGKAVSITSDTGYFWFSSASNVEVVAKLVDFCAGPASNVSLYTTGLTDLDVTLRVTDTMLGGTRSYHNPVGNPFSLIRDAAFSCNAPASPAPDAGWLLPSVSGPISETTGWTDLVPGPRAGCTPDASTLCLLDGRFQVRAAYSDYGGNAGAGKAAALTADTGTFWFFGPSNVEVVAKMVSFCGGGTNNVAVYAGGLTDVQVTLTVTDTATGLTKTYTNPLGTLFQLVRDGPFACR